MGTIISFRVRDFKLTRYILCRFRDDWAMRHFLHPKLLRKAREVRAQLEDIMKFQKMDIISAGTDFDIIRYVRLKYTHGIANMF